MNTTTLTIGGPRDDEFARAMARAKAEFLEMPGLAVTTNQATRLFAIESDLCELVLTTLVESRFLVRTRHAMFAERVMSYEISLWCGCRLYVACHPQTGVAHSRVIERRGDACRERSHDVGVRLALWELLPKSRNEESAAAARATPVDRR